LLHGDFVQAGAWNPLATVMLPSVAIWLVWATSRVLRRRPLPIFDPPTWLLRVVLFVLLVFWVARNLPFFPFELLAPRRL
jgi:hypothetical protein